jgi:hypothetical protein
VIARAVQQQEVARRLAPVRRLRIEATQQPPRILEAIPGHVAARHRAIEIEPGRAVERARHELPLGQARHDLAGQKDVAVGGEDPVRGCAPNAGVLGEELHELQARVLGEPRVPGTADDDRAMPPRQPLAQQVGKRRTTLGWVPLDQREPMRDASGLECGVIEGRGEDHPFVEVLAAVVVVAAAQHDLELAHGMSRRPGFSAPAASP